MAVNYINVEAINSGIRSNVEKFIADSESIYKSRISEAAEYIYTNRFAKPLVLLSGPSGSGKTTSAFRIENLLREKGLTVHTLSMDNYFTPGGTENLPTDEDGNIDLESPQRVDIALFTDHLQKLFRCEPIEVPTFDFATQSRTAFTELRRSKDDIIIIEGIHALNPSVTGDTDSFTTCIYVSVRTRIRGTNGEILHPRKIRLMRRLNRDCLFRHRKPEAVIQMYKSVTRGEEKFIMPFKHRADFTIDTFIPYEAAAYSKMLLSTLSSPDVDMSSVADTDKMLEIMKQLTPINSELIPSDSIVREFVGGSSLKY